MSGEVNPNRGPAPGIRDSEAVLAEVDRELRTALSVEPSAAFEARVLQRIEHAERARPLWFFVGRSARIPVLLAAAALLIVIAGGIYLLRAPAIDTARPLAVHREGRDVVLPPAPGPAAPSVQPVLSTPDRRAHDARTQQAAARPPEPEVIVPLNQGEALRRLVAAVNEGRIDALPEPPQATAQIVVQPLVVEPIPVPVLEPGTASPVQPNRGV